MKTIYFTLVVISLLLAGCNKRGGYRYEIVPTGKKISLSLSEETKCFSTSIVYYNDLKEGRFVVIENEDLNRIEFYNMASGKLSYVVNFMYEGPNAIYKISGFVIKNLDSIFVVNSRSIEGYIYLTNRNGQILKKYKINCENILYPFSPSPPNSVLNTTCIIENDSIITIPSHIVVGLKNQSDLGKFGLLAQLNFKDEYSKILPLSYPIIYNKAGAPTSSNFSFIKSNKRYIFSFAHSDDIYFSDDLKNISKIKVSSSFIKRDFISDNAEDNWNMKKTILSPSYKSIYYDRKNNVYYRFVKLGDEPDPNQSFYTQLYYPNNFSIMILNEDFKVIGETKMFKDKYAFSMSFITEEGLYISTSSVYNPDFNENQMEFELFTLKRKSL